MLVQIIWFHLYFQLCFKYLCLFKCCYFFVSIFILLETIAYTYKTKHECTRG